MANNPLVSFHDAVRIEVRSGAWVFVLIGLEVIRQIHFLISEHWARYHRFWVRGFFGGVERVTRRRLRDWTRFRLWRLLTWVFWIVIIAVVAGRFLTVQPGAGPAASAGPALARAAVRAADRLPCCSSSSSSSSRCSGSCPGAAWTSTTPTTSRPGSPTSGARTTSWSGSRRTSSSWRTRTLIESRGGYVPGGILLWGPPGTGKTLMAEAVAGETGRPYVFVDPGAFINMFMGVGILKVKSLFRKLRQLALRYGGVIVFFDEADSLGRRGALAQGGPPGQRGTALAPQLAAGCHGFSYLSRGCPVAAAAPRRGRRRAGGARHPAQQADHGRHGRRRRRHGHAGGAAHRDFRAEEAARLRQPLRPAAARGCGPSRRPSTGSWS